MVVDPVANYVVASQTPDASGTVMKAVSVAETVSVADASSHHHHVARKAGAGSRK